MQNIGGRDLKSRPQIRYSPKSIQRAVAWMIFCIFVRRNPSGNRYVLYLNWNEDRWYSNWNWLENDFNSNYRVVRLCNYLYSPAQAGVFVLNLKSNCQAFFRFHLIASKELHIFYCPKLRFPS